MAMDLETVNRLHEFMALNNLSATTKAGLFLILSPDGSAVTGRTWPNLFDALTDAQAAIDAAKGRDRSSIAVAILEALQSGFYYVVPSKPNDRIVWSIYKSEDNQPLNGEPARQSLSNTLQRVVELVSTKRVR